MKHDKNLTASARAILAAGKHLRRKDAGDDPVELLSRKIADLTDASVKRIEKAEEKMAELSGSVIELAQKAARGGGGNAAQDTWGEQFIRDQETAIKSLSEANKGQVSMTMKAVTTGSTSAGALVAPDRDPDINALPRRRMTIRGLMPVVEITSGAVEYVHQTARPAGAAPVAEGALKPESDMSFELRNTTAKVIAHWIKVSRQAVEDLPQLRDIIDTEMLYGLAEVEENQILNGNGTGQNLPGLMISATPFVDPLGLVDPTMIDTLGAAILQSALADFPATGIVVHPADWARMRLLKDADSKYILGEPGAVVEPRLFGLPVVATKAMATGEFLVGDFANAATLYDRWQARVEVGYVNDDFTRNLVTVLAEERLAMAVKNEAALTKGEFA